MSESGFHYRNGIFHADAVDLNDVAQEYGTPSYVYSAGMIRDNIARLRTALGPDVLIAYACKANTNRAVLSIMASEGLGADVVSGGELRRAIAAGIPAEKIVFSGVGKTDGELRLAFDHDIAQINIESAAELERIVALNPARPVRVGFRLNPDVEANTHAKISTGHGESKFGMPSAEIRQLYKEIARYPMIRPTGISTHIGSQLTELEAYRDAFHALAALAGEVEVESLDFGGGLGIVYTDEQPVDVAGYAQLVHDILTPLGKKLTTEPGRYLVGNAGVLLARVIDMKKTPGKPILILDAGMNDLMRPAMYDAIHVMNPVTMNQNNDIICDVAGPVCESSDIFLRGWTMAEPARGDVMALMNAGAYGFSMAGTYNSRPLPAEILVDGDRHAVIRTRQDMDDIVKGETVPGWLG
ncbi:MAG: Diaminopimelate decarboxylase [Micavibrio sp.]|nr:Diaminopimelate decarboxylase [Micavibrio sp.]